MGPAVAAAGAVFAAAEAVVAVAEEGVKVLCALSMHIFSFRMMSEAKSELQIMKN